MTASFSISAFGDEISKDLSVQLETLTRLKIHGLDLRGARKLGGTPHRKGLWL